MKVNLNNELQREVLTWIRTLIINGATHIKAQDVINFYIRSGKSPTTAISYKSTLLSKLGFKSKQPTDTIGYAHYIFNVNHALNTINSIVGYTKTSIPTSRDDDFELDDNETLSTNPITIIQKKLVEIEEARAILLSDLEVLKKYH